MEGFINHTDHQHDTKSAIADPTPVPSTPLTTDTLARGSAIQDANFEAALNRSLSADEHDHAPPVNNRPELHISLDKVASARKLDVTKLGVETSFRDNFGVKGDFFNPRGGRNTVIATGDDDVIRAAGRGFNTITTGTGKDTVILGRETTNRIFDFDPANDRFVLSPQLAKNIVIAQGQNPGRGGLGQPLDSVNNAMIIDKRNGHILAAMPFVKASDLSEANFELLTPEANRSTGNLRDLGFRTIRGNGKLTGNQSHNRMIGGNGDDFLYVGDDGFKFNTAKGGDEFPFPTDSPGVSELNLELKNGVLKANGTYQDFDAFPLFSQGEKEIDPNAKILNGSNPQALVEGFLRVPKDVEGNLISGTHLHYGPAGDSRGNFADATVIRFFNNTPTDAKSGTFSGEFKLTPDEQAALLAGTLYVNLHTNIDGDGDGRAGFPTGEDRINLNRDVVQFV